MMLTRVQGCHAAMLPSMIQGGGNKKRDVKVRTNATREARGMLAQLDMLSRIDSDIEEDAGRAASNPGR